MKRLLILFLMMLFLTGCRIKESAQVNEPFILSEEEQDMYRGLIDETLKSFYWYYDTDSLEYYKGIIPKKDKETEVIFNASDLNGFDLSKYSGREDVLYSCDLIHYNKNKAGTAYFYFANKKMAGCYYVPEFNDELILDFKTRNVYAKGTPIKNKETNASEILYKKLYANSAPNGFISEGRDKNGNGLYLNIENESLQIYSFSGNRFWLLKTIRNFGEGLAPINASFLKDGTIAVILGRHIETINEGDDHRTSAERLVFLNEKYEILSEEISFTKATYSCVTSEDENLILINERSLDIYTKADKNWVLENSYNIGVQATYIAIDDIDKDGNKEYIITDSKDLYIFRKSDINLNCIWRTNISVENFYGGVYLGDINGDGAMEIYMADITGTAIRYTLGENGLVAKNDDISYGELFYVGDFNGDGLSDYILSEGIENAVKTIYLAEK